MQCYFKNDLYFDTAGKLIGTKPAKGAISEVKFIIIFTFLKLGDDVNVSTALACFDIFNFINCADCLALCHKSSFLTAGAPSTIRTKHTPAFRDKTSAAIRTMLFSGHYIGMYRGVRQPYDKLFLYHFLFCNYSGHFVPSFLLDPFQVHQKCD